MYCLIIDYYRSLINVLSRYGVRMIPKPSQLRKLLENTASYEPCAAISTMHKGIPNVHAPYWSQKSAIDLYQIHTALNATPAKVLHLLKLPDFENPAEEEVFNYLQCYIGQMNLHHIRHFLRFVTGSSFYMGQDITITFNSLEGFGRCVISHT